MVGNPSLLDADDLGREFLSLLLHVAELVLEGTSVLIVLATTLDVKVGKLSVELINLELLLGDIHLVLLLKLLLLFDFLLLGGTLSLELLQFVLKKVILLLGVEVINLHTRDFIVEILDFDFFLGDVLVLVLCLLEEVGGTLLDSFLLGGVVDDVITDGLGLTMEHHDGLGEDGLLALHFLFGESEVFHLGIGVVERALQKDELLAESLFLSLFTLVGLFDHLNVFLEGGKFAHKLLGLVLFSTGLGLEAGDFRVQLHDLIVLLGNHVFNSLESLITSLHLEDTLLPIIHQRLLTHDDSLNLKGSLFESVSGSSSLFLL